MDHQMKSLLGIELPIIQAPMAGVQGSALAIAVSDAGGLGSLPCGMLTPEQVIDEINTIKRATANPFNLNFFCHQVQAYDAQQHASWQTQLAPYFNELGVECESQPKGASRVPFSHEMADAVEAFNPPIISFHFGLPEPTLLKRVKSWGTKVISSATTLKEGLWLEAQGVDAIIAQGFEAGGHRGMFLTRDVSTQMGLAALVPQLASQVQVPVIAAGGIGCHQGVKAALTLGAVGVQVGTAYLLTNQATTSPLHRAAITSDAAMHTAITNVFSGRPARGIVNRVMRELGYMSPHAPDFPYAAIELTQLRQVAEKHYNSDFSPLWCGQNSQACRAICASELTLSLAGKIQ
ncbi:NAD(P)H-dependent flavin oxidoreductase [Shewanella algidipiscicola]|uniref:Propionate 3-nitronate monooxygenase n=1 Tax=Shewanella algidipiscicola TaxID=614070 RepID=A0ABQ4NS94_9GAMM|nr:nitronate monooxygenase [Shewanella algidipiscicola]GIU01930.1 2-nitropropane dioxygenase [Shewanella algidipiscicola]